MIYSHQDASTYYTKPSEHRTMKRNCKMDAIIKNKYNFHLGDKNFAEFWKHKRTDHLNKNSAV
jgi:hypothetical protein